MATAPPPPPPPLLDASNPATSLPPPLTPSPAATSPFRSPLPASGTYPPSPIPAGRGKSLRWSSDTPPTGKSGDGGVIHPSFKEVLLAAVNTAAAPENISPSAVAPANVSPTPSADLRGATRRGLTSPASHQVAPEPAVPRIVLRPADQRVAVPGGCPDAEGWETVVSRR
jgi:hypothetical protein